MSLKLIILAAGQGTRLRPLTDSIPKCLVPLQGRPLLEYQISAAKQVGIGELHVVAGYREDVIQYPSIVKHINEDYSTTNMVSSLFAAENELNCDVIISYGDIVYQPSVLKKLMDSSTGVSVVVDNSWKAYWQARMPDPIADAETLRLREDGTIIELGRKPNSIEDIQGQYIGLIKFSAGAVSAIRSFYHDLDRSKEYEGRTIDQMYMTTFLQLIADDLMPIHAVTIDNGWMEIDCEDDLGFTDFLGPFHW